MYISNIKNYPICYKNGVFGLISHILIDKSYFIIFIKLYYFNIFNINRPGSRVL